MRDKLKHWTLTNISSDICKTPNPIFICYKYICMALSNQWEVMAFCLSGTHVKNTFVTTTGNILSLRGQLSVLCALLPQEKHTQMLSILVVVKCESLKSQQDSSWVLWSYIFVYNSGNTSCYGGDVKHGHTFPFVLGSLLLKWLQVKIVKICYTCTLNVPYYTVIHYFIIGLRYKTSLWRVWLQIPNR